MGILYGMVARGQVVLAEFSAAATTNANTVARQIMEKARPDGSDSNASYSHGRYIFHVKHTDGLTVLCMADDFLERRIPFAFLEEIHQRFVKTYGCSVLTAAPYSMNDEFSRILSQEMERYSNDPTVDKLNRLKSEMNQVQTVMLSNIDKVLERGDRLELLVRRTCELHGKTQRFRKQSRRFKNTVWWGNCKITGACLLLLAVIIYIVLAFLCGGPLMKSCMSEVFGVS